MFIWKSIWTDRKHDLHFGQPRFVHDFIQTCDDHKTCIPYLTRHVRLSTATFLHRHVKYGGLYEPFHDICQTQVLVENPRHKSANMISFRHVETTIWALSDNVRIDEKITNLSERRPTFHQAHGPTPLLYTHTAHISASVEQNKVGRLLAMTKRVNTRQKTFCLVPHVQIPVYVLYLYALVKITFESNFVPCNRWKLATKIMCKMFF